MGRAQPRGRKQRSLGPADSPEVVTVAVTCRLDERAHAVPDTELTAPHAVDSGRYHALCGYVVSPAPLVAPDGRPCDECAAATSDPARRRRGRSA